MTEAPTFQCSVCGAPARPGAPRCDFCGAAIATLSCSRCFKLNMSEALHCSGCGAELGLLSERELRETLCSDCRVSLTAVAEPAGTLLDCQRCGGQFVEHALLRSWLERHESVAEALLDARSQRHVRKQPLERVHYRPCVVCGQMMNRKNFGGTSGVIVDVCAKHGTWFDPGELSDVLGFVRTGGLVRERQRQRERDRLERSHEREQRDRAHSSPEAHFELSHEPGFARDLLAFLHAVLSGD